MPIVAPDHLTGSRPRGEYIELPPPPETSADDSPASGAEQPEFAFDPRSLVNDRLSQQLQSLQEQQSELFRLQRATMNRLERLEEALHESSMRIETTVDQRHAAEFPQGPSF